MANRMKNIGPYGYHNDKGETRNLFPDIRSARFVSYSKEYSRMVEAGEPPTHNTAREAAFNTINESDTFNDR